MPRQGEMTEATGEVALDPRALRFGDPRAAIAYRAASWRSDRAWLLVGALAAVGLIVRMLLVRSIWVDEAISIQQAHMSLPAMLHELRQSDVHPPLYFVLLWCSTRIFGFGDMAVHFPSILAGTLLVPAMFLAGRELFDRRTGLVAAGLVAFAPLVIWYSQEARGYAILMLLATLAVWAQMRVLRDGRARYWFAYGGLTIALAYAEYWSLLLVAIQQFVFGAVAWRRAHRGESVRGLLIGCWLTWLALIVALTPLASFAYDQFHANQAIGFSRAPAPGAPSTTAGSSLSVYAVLSNLVWAIWGYHANGTMLKIAALWPLLMLLSLMLLGRGRSRATLLVVALALGPMLAMLAIGLAKRQLFEVRYFAVAVPMLLLLCARAVSAPSLRRAPALLATGALFASILGACADQQLSSNPRDFNFRGALETVKRETRPGDLLLYTPNYLRDVVAYYAPRLHSEPLHDPARQAAGAKRVFLLGSFLDTAGEAGKVGAARYDLGHGPRRLVAAHSDQQVRTWVYR
jgi:hypothetical protein